MDLSPFLEGSHEAVILRTSSYQCKPLVVSGPPTLKLKHLLYVIEKASECPVVAVEVYVYLTCEDGILNRHFFVSKADTTGLGAKKLSVAGVVTQFMRYLLSVNPQSYLENARWRRKIQPEADLPVESEFNVVNTLLHLSRRLKEKPEFYDSILFYGSKDFSGDEQAKELWKFNSIDTSISLFTRSAGAYLFPGSEKNSGKHVADGNTLFKWWISVLLKALDESWELSADIPGSDKREVSRFFPQGSNWTVSNIYEAGSHLAVFRIPVFPDDPKGRFLEHLVVEGRYKSLNTSQFWNELGFRQEFRLGNTVGIIGCVQKSQPHFSTEDRDTVVTLKAYKKVIESIKGENYNVKEEVQSFIQSGLPEIYRRCGVKVNPMTINGKKKNTPNNMSSTVQTKEVNKLSGSMEKRPEAIDLNGLVRKKPGANDLSGLVRRKPEAQDLTSIVRNKPEIGNSIRAEGKKKEVNDLSSSVKRKAKVNDLNGLVKRKSAARPASAPVQVKNEVNDLTMLKRRKQEQK